MRYKKCSNNIKEGKKRETGLNIRETKQKTNSKMANLNLVISVIILSGLNTLINRL